MIMTASTVRRRSARPSPPPLLPETRPRQPLSPHQIDFYVSECHDPCVNLAFEEWLFRRDPASSPSHTLLLYRNSRSVIIGRNQNPWLECNTGFLRTTNTPLVRRRSGGGTVYHDLGNTNYSLTVPRAEFSRTTASTLAARALHDLDIPASLNSRHDIVVHDRKVSGSAFKVVKDKAYHHGTMLIDTDLSTLRDSLRPDLNASDEDNNKHDRVDRSPIVLAARGVRSVPSPTTTLRDHSLTVTHDDFCDAMITQVAAFYMHPDDLSSSGGGIHVRRLRDGDVSPEIARLADELRYPAWTYGETPEFKLSLRRSTNPDSLVVEVTIREGRIADIVCDGDPTVVHVAHACGLVGRPFRAAGLYSNETQFMIPPGVAIDADTFLWLKSQLID